MSSINPYPTFFYSQPEEYRFSHDSVFLARLVYEYIYKNNLIHECKTWDALDLCAGCGIIGLDFLYHFYKQTSITPKTMDFLEVQDVYKPYFQENLKKFFAVCDTEQQIKIHWLQKNYTELSKFKKKYNLILCNPPYFFKEQGQLPPSSFKARCRFFIDATFEELILSIKNSLHEQGFCFLLLRDNSMQTLSTTAQTILGDGFVVSNVDPIRGTHLVLIKHSLFLANRPV